MSPKKLRDFGKSIGPVVLAIAANPVYRDRAEHLSINGLRYVHKVAIEKLPGLIDKLEKRHKHSKFCSFCYPTVNFTHDLSYARAKR